MPKSADAFRTISEVADWLGIPAHVLRFWESKFTQVKPVKRAGGRRYYRPADMQLLGGIRKLLHDEGMTIKGVQKVLREQGLKHVMAMSPMLDMDDEPHLDDITLAVAPEVEEERGRVLSFERGPGAQDEADAATKPSPAKPSPDSEAAASEAPESAEPMAPEPAPEPQPEERPVPGFMRAAEPAPEKAPETPTETPAQTVAPDPEPEPEPATEPEPEPDISATQKADPIPEPEPEPDPIALPRATPITTPADPPDDIVAPAAALSTLAEFRDPVSPDQARTLSDIAARLRALRGGAGKSGTG